MRRPPPVSHRSRHLVVQRTDRTVFKSSVPSADYECWIVHDFSCLCRSLHPHCPRLRTAPRARSAYTYRCSCGARSGRACKASRTSSPNFEPCRGCPRPISVRGRVWADVELSRSSGQFYGSSRPIPCSEDVDTRCGVSAWRGRVIASDCCSSVAMNLAATAEDGAPLLSHDADVQLNWASDSSGAVAATRQSSHLP